MVNIIQSQSTLSHPTQMKVDGGAGFHGFGYKHPFYALFVRPTYIHVAVNSAFSASGMVLVTVMFPDSPTLHALDPAYWTRTYCTNTLPLSAIKLCISFCGESHEALYPLLTHHFFPSPLLPLTITSTPLTNQKTCGCANIPTIN